MVCAPCEGGVNNFYALVHDERQRQDDSTVVLEVVEIYRQCVRDAMLTRIVMFGGDPVFQSIAAELATVLNIDVDESSTLLWPTSHAIYEAAANIQLTEDLESTAEIPHLDSGIEEIPQLSKDDSAVALAIEAAHD